MASSGWECGAGRESGGRVEARSREELSLDVKITRKLVEHTDPYTGDQLVNFICTSHTSRIEASDELAEARWFNLNEIQKMKTIHPGLEEGLTKLLGEAMSS